MIAGSAWAQLWLVEQNQNTVLVQIQLLNTLFTLLGVVINK